jgi:type IV pilus assembly protein PilX
MSDMHAQSGRRSGRSAQHGMVLITSLLLLMVVTIFAISMFRSFGIEEKIAGNTRDKERARASAMTALQYAEWWIAQGNWANDGTCTPQLLVAPAQGLICLPPPITANGYIANLNNIVSNVANVPWMVGGQEVGTVYTPTTMNVTNAAAPDYYYGPPRFYISFIGANPSTPQCGNFYQIDAWGYGTSANTVAVVESTFELTWTSGCSALF